MTIHRFPLVLDPLDRDGSQTKDARLINCVVELLKEGTPRTRTRPGTSNLYTPTSASGRGNYWWNGSYYCVVGSTLYKDNVAITGAISGTDRCFFTSTQGATPYLVVKNSANMYYYDGTTLSTVTSGGYPSSTVAGVAYIDGYVCVITADSKIYQSGIDDPTTWSGDYISAEVNPDNSVALYQHISYLVAFGDYSVEFFYDAANATGSPFSKYTGSLVSYGCAFGNSVSEGDGVIAWVAQSRIGGLFVVAMSGTTPTTISTGPVEKILQSQSWSDIDGMVVRSSGHVFYIITAYTASYAQAVTLVYDFESKKWYEWYSGTLSYFPYIDVAYDNDLPVLQHLSNGRTDYISDSYSTDNGTAIAASIYSPIFDAGVINRKFLGRATVVGDQVSSSTLDLSFSDDDYQTESITYSLDMSTNRPFAAGLGSFYRRSFHLNWTGEARIDGLELDFEIGG